MPAETPVIGMVSRLTPQKGLDLVRAVLGDIMGENVAFVVLGSGEREYEDFFREAAYRYCGRMAVRTEYNNALAHRIYCLLYTSSGKDRVPCHYKIRQYRGNRNPVHGGSGSHQKPDW